MAQQWTRKYRPTSLDSYVGNERLKEEMRTHISNKRVPQMLLLEGPAGTGKTTLARLLAKSMVCTNLTEGKACGECLNCTQLTDDYILNGETPIGSSVKDYNISNMNTVEDADRIISEMRQMGFNETNKVYILDEVQEASPRAQASFLKIAEEPPEGLHIILCTTHPDKLANAFKSRFIRRRVVKPTVDELVDRLVYISREEGIDYTREGLKLLVSRVGTIPRESINQAEYIGSMGAINRHSVEASLGVISLDTFIDFLNATASMEITKIHEIYKEIDSRGMEIQDFIRGFGDFLVTAIKAKAFNDNILQEYSPSDLKEVRRVMKELTEEQIANAIKVSRNYTNARDEFEYYAYVFNLADLFVEEVGEIDEVAASHRRREVTEKVVLDRGSNKKKKEDPLTNDDLSKFFSGGN